MAYTDIDKSDDYFNTVLYTGNGSTQSITGVNFTPDWLWIKSRGSTGNGRVHDVVRGVDKQLYTSLANAEFTYSPNTGVTSFDSDGFSLGSDIGQNTNTETYVAWNWLADNTTGASNTDGSITSTVSANTTSGFSIVSYTGAGGNQTIGHGLGVVPSMILVKTRSTAGDWTSYHSVLGNTKFMRLNSTNAVGTQSTYWQDTDPTSSVFSVGNAGDVNSSGQTHIAYCFAEKKGFSKFGSYTGNGNADGTFVYTGFKPAWVMFKGSSFSGENWDMYDNKRETFNVMDTTLKADSAGAESSNSLFNVDFLSNGIKLRNGHTGTNQSGSTYIYMAFAENPFVTSTGIPTTAR